MSDYEWTAEDQAWADKQMEESAKLESSRAEDDRAAATWLRKMKRKNHRCGNCTDGIDGEPDGFGGSIAGRCLACGGTGWVPKTAAIGADTPKAQGVER